MNSYDNLLRFNGSWRSYQKRVLENADTYLQDGKIHIVAAPGSGKTTLGIELIRRIGRPALILSPRIVIREQWLNRIKEAFLISPEQDRYLSNDIKETKLITSITYQTLYSAMTRFQGKINEKEREDAVQEVDFSDFDFIQTVKNAGIGVICLDECHHLQSEWWKALEDFVNEMGKNELRVVSLTATPPYDSTPSQWERYVNLCGAIDEEIIVPELVREKCLCPHQDYVYFNFPTKEEEAQVRRFKENVEKLIQTLLEDPVFAKIIVSHRGLSDYEGCRDFMLEDPPYLSSLLIFCQEKGISFDKRWKKLLGVRHLPAMNARWMEVLLQKVLFDDPLQFVCQDSYREEVIRHLKKGQFIIHRKVGLVYNEGIQKVMINSLGKIESIKAIAKAELIHMKKGLRMLILTDYIRKEYLSLIGHPEKEIKSIGVLPLFEVLRRELGDACRLGVLCGSMIILPVQAVEYLIRLAKNRYGRADMITVHDLAHKQQQPLGYVQIVITGKRHEATRLITEVFKAGYIQILIGTKSLLGEGWDSPCINSLVLASFVGSYVLSNQMRGRAIRVMPGHPEKTSNIWHLVCIENEKEVRSMRRMGVAEEELSMDYATLKRRMRGFIGVSYDGSTIENGVERLNIINGPYDYQHVQEINQKMIQMAENRDVLRLKWEDAVLLYDKMEVSDECDILKAELKTRAAFINIIGLMLLNLIMMACFQAIVTGAGTLQGKGIINILLYYAIMLFLAERLIELAWKGIKYLTPLRYLKQIGIGIQQALEEKGQIKSPTRVETKDGGGALYQIYLKGGTAREKDMFSTCVEEFLGTIENQRYLLYRKHAGIGMLQYFCVPELFAKTKEDAIIFTVCIKKAIGKYHLIYTRNPEGRKILLRARARAYANRADRKLQQMYGRRRKKVKGALE